MPKSGEFLGLAYGLIAGIMCASITYGYFRDLDSKSKSEEDHEWFEATVKEYSL